ncbi:very-long-chain aldehyde decarbonylase GL1-10 [Miscanthus floridulus]|uniref:very-long-chain aldehyde decarbonylase GL1-10 n=1 Tax=Miscanthus floridulus TaxID=154761 RepID=UPI003457407F
MLPYATAEEAEAALGRAMTPAEALWFRYTAGVSDYHLYCCNILFLFVVFTVAPLPVALLELRAPAAVSPYKLQPRVRLSRAEFVRCYKDVLRIFFLVIGPLQLVSFPMVKLVGIHTKLPLPSLGEMAAQLLVYFLVEDYLNYWIHRLLHGEWGYQKIHRVHHEFTAPIGFAAPYAHWAEVLILGIPSFVGPAIAPGHMITLWLWIVLRQVEAIETHSGFDFPFTPTKYIPFYGGAEYHDYHHYVGGQSQSNFASVFTYCDYLYGTDRGYRFHKAYLAKLKDLGQIDGEKGDGSGLSYVKLD